MKQGQPHHRSPLDGVPIIRYINEADAGWARAKVFSDCFELLGSGLVWLLPEGCFIFRFEGPSAIHGLYQGIVQRNDVCHADDLFPKLELNVVGPFFASIRPSWCKLLCLQLSPRDMHVGATRGKDTHTHSHKQPRTLSLSLSFSRTLSKPTAKLGPRIVEPIRRATS